MLSVPTSYVFPVYVPSSGGIVRGDAGIVAIRAGRLTFPAARLTVTRRRVTRVTPSCLRNNYRNNY